MATRSKLRDISHNAGEHITARLLAHLMLTGSSLDSRFACINHGRKGVAIAIAKTRVEAERSITQAEGRR